MHITHTYLIDSDSGMVSRQRHTQSRLTIFGFRYRLKQPMEDALNRKAGIFLASAAIPHADIRLNTVSQRIDSRGSGNGSG